MSRATLIGYGKTALTAQGETVRQLGLDQAAANLRLAFAHGYNNLGLLRSDRRYALLLSRDDLKPMLKALDDQERSPETDRAQ